ncbi:MAG: penicillin-binding transpeptidase domain-containing protein, partial [Oscillospiraceae bacterium]|nr:penicillin-binding transpeptidase domain-containing protein [Oscillospiraceae bacterium]
TSLDRLDDFAQRFGLGELTDIGFGEVAGQRSTWDNFLALNQQLRPNDPFYQTVFGGQVVQVGIGQGVSLFTPLQLANYTAMIATGGVRYRPTLLREVRSYDGTYTIYFQEPEILLDMRDEDPRMEAWFTAIQEGMRRTSTHGTAARHLANFRIPVASKTGTVELRAADATGPYPHGVFVAYAPMDDPQIAVAVVIEHGGSGSAVIPVATAIFEHFFQDHVVDQRLPLENVMLR